MQRAYNKNTNGPVTEMAIVNTFTKLIFRDEGLTDRELSIIQAFRVVDAGVLRDSIDELGDYLRSLGVREMIQLVSRLRQHMTESDESHAAIQAEATPAVNVGLLGQNRDTR